MPVKFPVSRPFLQDSDRQNLVEAFDSGWISSNGEFNNLFESTWAQEVGTRYSVSVTNGTCALHLALLSIGVGPGDEVVVPNLTFVASANSVLYCGATPVFADVNPDTWCIDSKTVEAVISRNTKAVIFVSLYGNPSGLLSLAELCNENGIYLIEDAAESHYAEISGVRSGSIGALSTFSFFGNKIISCGEGGAICTSNEKLRDKIVLLRDQGMSKKRRYFHEVVGYNYRLTNLHAAILVSQIINKNLILQKRTDVFAEYDSILKSDGRLQFQSIDSGVEPAKWLYTFRIKSANSNIVSGISNQLLEEFGIETRPIFVPITEMPPYNKYRRNLPNSTTISNTGISLPSYPSLKESEIQYICERFLEVLDAHY